MLQLYQARARSSGKTLRRTHKIRELEPMGPGYFFVVDLWLGNDILGSSRNRDYLLDARIGRD